jgi:hypothetical protein
MLLEHRQQRDALFGLAVRIYEGFFKERVEPAPSDPRMAGPLVCLVSLP